MRLTNTDKDIFIKKGVLHLKGGASTKNVNKIKQTVVSELERLKLRVGGKLVSSKFQNMPVFQQTTQLSQMIKMGPELDEAFTSDVLLDVMSQLAEAELKPAHLHPQLLLSFPHKEEWSLNRLNWHLDLAVPKQDFIPGIQAFLLIDEVTPKGGATLALSGSHKLHYVSEGNDARNSLPEIDAKFLKPQTIKDIEISIVEMSGRAGDIYLMDMRTLHTPSVNVAKAMRMMATNRYLR